MAGERKLVVIAAALAALFAFGALRATNPDFDLAFGVEAYRDLPRLAFVAAVALLAVVMQVRPVAAYLGNRFSRSSRLRLPVFLAFQAGLFLVLTDTSLSGDGGGIVFAAAKGRVTASNPLSSLLHAGLVAAGLEPREAIRLLSVAAGVAYSWLAVLVGRECFEDRANQAATTALLVTCGAAWLFFGSIELYAPVAAGLLAYLWLGLRWIAGKDRLPWAPLALGAVAALHGAALALLPTLLVLFFRGPRRSFGRLLPWAAAFAAPLAAVGAGLYWGVWGGELPEPGQERYGNFLGSMGQTLFLPLAFTPTNVTYRYALLDAEHLVGVVNLVVLAAPVGLGLALLGKRRHPAGAFLAAATGLLVLLPLLLNVSYSLRRDWDLFVWLGVPLSLLGALRFLDSPGSWTRTARIAALGVFTFLPVVFVHAGDRIRKRGYAHELALVYAAVGYGDAAARWRRAAEELDPDDVLRRTAAIKRRFAEGDVDGAAAGVREQLAVEPTNSWAHVAHAELLALEGKHGQARAELEEAVRLAPEGLRQRPRRLLAQYALEDRDDDEAIRQLERALREEVVNAREAVLLLDALARIRRAAGDAVVADALERLAVHRTTTGSKGEP